MKALLSGKHYNRCWWVHEIVNDALERLFINQYLMQDDKSIRNLQILKEAVEIKESVLNNETVINLVHKYNQIKEKGLNGELGKTPQFWLKYMEMVSKLHLFHFAINTNNYSLKVASWDYFLPLCFTTNKIHYARYGTFYIQQLKNLDSTHPEAVQEIEHFISVRRNTFGIGQAIDLAGEQTYMKNAKTAGGITQFAVKPETVAKRVLSRPFQTRFVEALFDMCGKSRTMSDPRKCLRVSEVRRSNSMVEKVMDVITKQFINPFETDLDKDNLYSLISGIPVDEVIVECLLSISQNEQEAMDSFINRLTVEEHKETFSDTI